MPVKKWEHKHYHEVNYVDSVEPLGYSKWKHCVLALVVISRHLVPETNTIASSAKTKSWKQLDCTHYVAHVEFYPYLAKPLLNTDLSLFFLRACLLLSLFITNSCISRYKVQGKHTQTGKLHHNLYNWSVSHN